MYSSKTITAADMKKPLNLSNKAFAYNKYGYYKWLRENDPVHQGKFMPMLNAYFPSRYEDCVSMLKDPRFVRKRSTATGSGGQLPFPIPKSVSLLMESMIAADHAEHRRLRNLVHKAFTPRRLVALNGRIEEITHQLLDKAERNGRMELLAEFARPIPTTVIAEMVGVDADEVPELSRFADAMADGMSGLVMAKTMMWDLPKAAKFMRGLVQRKRANPTDDILSALIEAEDEGERLSEDELIAMVFLLIIAGHETTYGLITNATYALLTNPDQLALLRESPERMDSAIEEALRYNGPAHVTKPEYASEEVTLSGVTIPRGATVVPLLGSANHDPDVFENPEQFDITREKNRHLGFGMGLHYCLGAPLARMETKIALTALLERNPNLRLAVNPSELELGATPGMHMYKAMPVVLG